MSTLCNMRLSMMNAACIRWCVSWLVFIVTSHTSVATCCVAHAAKRSRDHSAACEQAEDPQLTNKTASQRLLTIDVDVRSIPIHEYYWGEDGISIRVSNACDKAFRSWMRHDHLNYQRRRALRLREFRYHLPEIREVLLSLRNITAEPVRTKLTGKNIHGPFY